MSDNGDNNTKSPQHNNPQPNEKSDGKVQPGQPQVNPQRKFTAGINKKKEKLNEDLSELDKLRQQLIHFQNQFRLAVADKENVKRIMQKNIDDTSIYAISNFARDLLSSCDNLETSLKNLKEGDSIHAGVLMTYKELLNTLERHNITRIDPIGEKFNPQFHKAVSQMVDAEKDDNTILHVVQPGYIIKDKLLRAASVIISKKSD
ncbi:grpE family protein [Ehrlichia chaffeensis str. Heartland]|uniref:Protein GrpE n=1 Tax=Ehrlichia chaffeensis (strain ATCC CRL-10679 / Arkansas) TaxID=205920 RepID=GRPE_EHRCR|nr:nucleotide exchange factor GrpE [Ehrlichia chaffeensis]Q2GHU0.1 RecName: Full=Protein GrpE; AltName: Full=HSP-70 cofactor [Ehrlichia chaffeensis str. Arkansas]ABD44781.1 co-chaperone GrpE [Ehrlichia chaffeensis str. Arkansas]AHX04038.1 grpE family protein [Ehrlichia chaffeensis str. Heartland]AHX05972.1 grpE family protein [Ehrlichia chaffeensis str. Jax]AHX06962.1 grpE family protein [Ehrlichia chaffeensis str. Liberty]AHX07828.1 grpE family protein [Ehrlichia chaffeensis str. Osceola]